MEKYKNERNPKPKDEAVFEGEIFHDVRGAAWVRRRNGLGPDPIPVSPVRL